MITRLFSWLCVAKRPLHWYEIQGAISVDVVKNCLNAHGRRLQGGPKDFCGSFVELYADDFVQLVHPTLKRYAVDSMKSFSLTCKTLSDRCSNIRLYSGSSSREITSVLQVRTMNYVHSV